MNYLQKHTLGSIIRGSFGIYIRNFVTLFLIYVLPNGPLAVIETVGLYSEEVPGLMRVIGVIISVAGSTIVYFPFTIAVSEICLGIRPSLGRAYTRAFARLGPTLGTYFLAFGAILLGFIALLIPGFVLSVFYMFVAPVVLLEGSAGRKAMRRSRELGRGHYGRNLGIYFVIMLIVYVLIGVVGGALGALAFLAGFANDPTLIRFVGAIAGILLVPPGLVALVLLYYDMRARKEGYGAVQLAEDLRV